MAPPATASPAAFVAALLGRADAAHNAGDFTAAVGLYTEARDQVGAY